MNKKDDFTKIDEELFKYFEIKKKVDHSRSTEYAIRNAFNNEEKNKKTFTYFIPKFAIYIFTILFLTTGVVFAKDIVNILSSFFTNTTQSIDTAIENGYVQNIDMDYVYDSNIGIKVNCITIDESNMDISYSYKVDKLLTVDYIELYDYEIKDEKGNLIYKYNEENNFFESKQLVNYIKNDNKMLKVDENIYNTSILYGANKFYNIKHLYINIKSIKINYQDVIVGNWNLDIEIDGKFNERDNAYYEIEPNKHILENEISLTETSLKIKIKVDENFDDKIVLYNKPILENELKDTYICSSWYNKNIENCSMHEFEFDISKYNENIDILYLKFKINENTELNVQLNKKK